MASEASLVAVGCFESGPGVPGESEAGAEGRSEMVLDVLFEDDCEDFRFTVTGLFLALAWNTVFVRFPFGVASSGGLIVSSLLAPCSIVDDMAL